MAKTFTPWLDWIDTQYDEMLAQTIFLANINSGSLNANGVNAVGKELKSYCRFLGAVFEDIEVPPYKRIDAQGEFEQHELGRALVLTKRPDAPLQLFLGAHLDTVFPQNHPFQRTHWIDKETLNGPGTCDLKGGMLVMLKALEALERTPWADRIGWRILFNPDEEIGSPSSAALIERLSRHCQLGLIYEPCFPDGHLAGPRKGSGNFSFLVKGRAAHAGREHRLGRNAIRAMSDFISALDDLNGQRPGISLNPGYIQGGGAVNVVPALCLARINIRIEQLDDERWCLEQIHRLLAEINRRDGIHIQVDGGFGRKPKQLSSANLKLFELTQECGSELGMGLNWLPTGGCCDGNNLTAAGVPNIDTLGVQGGNIHSSDEYLKVRSLTERARLSTLLLLKLATSDHLDWLARPLKQRCS